MSELIYIKAKTGASQNKVVPTIDPDTYTVYTTAQPHDNEANKKIISLIADFLDTPKSQISIVQGQKSRIKKIKLG